MVELRIEFGARSLVEGMVVVDDRANHQEHEDDECDDGPRKKPAGRVTSLGFRSRSYVWSRCHVVGRLDVLRIVTEKL